MAQRVLVKDYSPSGGFGERDALIRQPENRSWACALNAFATASGISSARIESILGHDGGSVIDDTLDTPDRFAGFSDAELIRAMLQLDVAVVPINFTDLTTTVSKIHWRNFACQQRSVIYYYEDIQGRSSLHAVACYDGVCCDVRKQIVRASQIPIESIEVIFIICDLALRA